MASFIPECEVQVPQPSPGDAQFNLNPMLKDSNGKCKRAQRLQIHYKLAQDFGQPLPGIPMMRTFDTTQPDAEEVGYFPVGVLMESVLMPTCRVGYLVQGYDSTGKVICAQNPGAEQMACELDRFKVQISGGVTTECNPNETYVKLVSSAKTISDCLASSGKLADKSSGSEVASTAGIAPTASLVIQDVLVTAANHSAYQSKYFCKISDGTSSKPVDCPPSWMRYNNWLETGAAMANVPSYYASSAPADIRTQCFEMIRDEPNICAFGKTRAEYSGNGPNTPSASSGQKAWSSDPPPPSERVASKTLRLDRMTAIAKGKPLCTVNEEGSPAIQYRYVFDCGTSPQTLSAWIKAVGCH